MSGGHINPAVTLGCVAAGKVTIIRAVFYIIAQCIGSIGGSAVVRVCKYILKCLVIEIYLFPSIFIYFHLYIK